jgi:hypothetical protein
MAIEIGEELYPDCAVDAMENMFQPVRFRIKEEIEKDATHNVIKRPIFFRTVLDHLAHCKNLWASCIKF